VDLGCVEELVDVSFSDPLLIDEWVFVDWVGGKSLEETLENQIGHTIDQLSDSESKNSS